MRPRRARADPNKQLLITGRSLDPSTGAVKLTFRTEDPTKHARVFARTGDVPPATDFYRPIVPGDNALPTRAAYSLKTQTNPYPLDSDAGSITIAAMAGNVLDDGSGLDLPAGSIAGLVAGTDYGVFWNLTSMAYEAQVSPAAAAMASNRYVFVGWITTTDADGTYPPTPTAPGGYGGNGSSGGGRQKQLPEQ